MNKPRIGDWLTVLAAVAVALAIGASIWAIVVDVRADNKTDCLQRWAVVQTRIDREQRAALLALANNRTGARLLPLFTPIRDPDC